METLTTYGDLTALLRQYHVPGMEELIFNSRPFLAMLRRNARPATGNQILQSVATTSTTLAGAIGRNPATWTTALQTQFDRVSWDWRRYRGSVLLEHWDQRLSNANANALANWMTEKMKVTGDSLQNVLASDVFADGTGGTPANSAIEGLNAALTDTTNPAARNYGTIDRSVAAGAYWRANVSAPAGLTNLTLVQLRNTKALAEERTTDNSSIDMLITTFALYDKLWELYMPHVQITENAQTRAMGSLGFESLAFENTAVTRDNACTANNWYFINSKTWQWFYVPSSNFETIGPIWAKGDPSPEWNIYAMMCPVCTAPRRNARRTNSQ